MLINPTPAANISTFVNPRQIAVSTQTISTVLYTVPAGKKFQGYIYSSALGNAVTITPSGGVSVAIDISTPFVASGSTAPMFTLLAGTIIVSGATSRTSVIGVESDL